MFPRWLKVGFGAILINIISLFIESVILEYVAIGSFMIFMLYPAYEIWNEE